MVGVQCIDLRDKVSGTEPLGFLTAELSRAEGVPFSLVRYSLNGPEQKLRLRLDLHKAIFLDHFEDARREAIIQQAAPQIVDILRNSDRTGEGDTWLRA